jgi:hypothetical protein
MHSQTGFYLETTKDLSHLICSVLEPVPVSQRADLAPVAIYNLQLAIPSCVTRTGARRTHVSHKGNEPRYEWDWSPDHTKREQLRRLDAVFGAVCEHQWQFNPHWCCGASLPLPATVIVYRCWVAESFHDLPVWIA